MAEPVLEISVKPCLYITILLQHGAMHHLVKIDNKKSIVGTWPGVFTEFS